MKKYYSFLLIIAIVAILVGTRQTAQASAAVWRVDSSPVKIDARVHSALENAKQGDMLTVIVTLRQQADLARVHGNNRAEHLQGVIQALQSTANSTQGPLNAFLKSRRNQGLVKKFESLWVINGFSVTASPDVIAELAQNPDVLSVSTDDLQIVPAYGTPEPNIAMVNAPALWSQGYTGAGMVVANLDSGVDVNHPDLSTRWRGGSNSWFDPYGQHPATPTDLSGHGTWTMGVMVGGDAGGTTIGVAPDARWIAAKIFNDAGSSTATAIHQSFQWLLDPDGNPSTADAPNVVNNSWTYANPGCYLDFEPDLQSLRAAGILPVFAAGNGGSSSNTSYSPANNPSAFAVGAINNNSLIYSLSSRGPTTCGGSSGPFPEIVAPGVYINTTDLYGSYYAASGTSLSAPHVAGGLALLLAAHPNLSAADQALALINSAVDLGVVGPDDVYGYGRLDLLAAFNWLANAPTSTPQPPTSTPTTAATFTFTPQVTNTSTPLPTSTFTAVPSATFTATVVSATTLHIGDLDRSSVLSGTKWNATVTIYVHNNNEKPVANATVTGKWTNGATGTVTCTTNSSGMCTVSKTGLATKTTSVTFTVTNITATSLTYKSTSNHDPDGDSTGTVIVISKP
jgi:subtilisin family serine protease